MYYYLLGTPISVQAHTIVFRFLQHVQSYVDNRKAMKPKSAFRSAIRHLNIPLIIHFIAGIAACCIVAVAAPFSLLVAILTPFGLIIVETFQRNVSVIEATQSFANDISDPQTTLESIICFNSSLERSPWDAGVLLNAGR